eukprot:Sdes_comp20068_c0_seq1m12965
MMLVEIGNSALGVFRNISFTGDHLIIENFHQRGFSHTIGSNNRNATVQINAEIQLLKQVGLISIPKRNIGEGQTRGRQRLGIGEVELDAGIVHVHFNLIAFQLFQHLHTTLSLLGQIAVTHLILGNVGLQVGLHSLLGLLSNQQVALALRSSLRKGVVISAIMPQFLAVKMINISTDRIQKLAFVGGNQQYLFPVFQIRLQPNRRLHIQMIGRLVQQQQIRLAIKRLSNRYPHAPTTTKLAGFHVLHLFIESEPRENFRGASHRRIRLDFVQTSVNINHLLRIFLPSRDQIVFLSTKPNQLLVRIHHRIDRCGVVPHNFLLNVHQTNVGRNRQFQTGNLVHKGGFSDAVSSNQPVSMPKHKFDIPAIDQFMALKSNVEI